MGLRSVAGRVLAVAAWLGAGIPTAKAEEPPEPVPWRLCAGRIVLTPEGLLAEEQVELRWAGPTLTAAALELAPGALRLEAPRLDPCGCGERSPWSVGAERAQVDLAAGRVQIEGLRLYAGRWPVLGLPALSLPLEALEQGPRAWPGLPAVGRGPDGWQIGVPVHLRLDGGRTLVVAPEWRQERGLRGYTALRGGALDAEAWGGWDTQAQAWRGAVTGQAAGEQPGLRFAAAGQWVSDAAWLVDFGQSLPGRTLPWTSTRALAQSGPLALELRAWQAGLGGQTLAPGAVPSLVLRAPALRRGPLAWQSAARAELQGGEPRLELASALRAADAVGPVLLHAEALARGWTGPGGPEGAARVEHRAALPLHRRGPHGAQELRLGLDLGASAATGTRTSPLTLADPTGLRWGGLGLADTPGLGAGAGGIWLAPTVRWVALGRAVGTLEAAAPWSAGGLGLALASQGALGPASAALSWVTRPWRPGAGVPEHLAALRLGWSGERLDLGLHGWSGGSRPGTQQGLARAALHLPSDGGVWSPAVVLTASPEGWQSAALGLDWRAPCGCAQAGVLGSVAVDQPGVRLGLSAALHPGQRPTPPLRSVPDEQL